MTVQETNIEHIGVTGAKRQTGLSTNPRAELLKVISDNQSSAETQIFDIFWSHIVDRERFDETKAAGYFKTIFEYWFANNYRSVISGTTLPNERTERANATRSRTKEMAASLSQGIEMAIERRAKIALLDMLLPNGKQLRHCTKQECSEISSNVGGFLAAVSDRVPDGKTVGEALSEKQLQDLYDATPS
jgi:hypothetical protein